MIEHKDFLNENLLAAILDHECGPANPFEIELHCAILEIYWIRIEHGYYTLDEHGKEVWNYGKYKIEKLVVG